MLTTKKSLSINHDSQSLNLWRYTL